MPTVKITREITVAFTGTVPAFIAAADELAPGGLDSRDAGDAVGAFIDAASAQTAGGRYGLPWRHFTPDASVTVDWTDDSYRWTPDTPNDALPGLVRLQDAMRSWSSYGQYMDTGDWTVRVAGIVLARAETIEAARVRARAIPVAEVVYDPVP